MIKNSPVVTSMAIHRFVSEAGEWLSDAPVDDAEVLSILKKQNITVVDAPLAVGHMMGDVRPPSIDSSRRIIIRPILREYIKSIDSVGR